MNITFWITIFALIVILGLIYNSLISRKNKVFYAFGGLDAFLKKRADLVPNLVNTVKGYMKHEKEVLEKITAIRSEVIKKNAQEDRRFQEENSITDLLKKIFISVENYPALKANENFLRLQETLNELEEQIAAARRAYNAAVYNYNNGIEMFPLNIVAKIIHYQKKEFFTATEEDKKAPSSH